MRDPLDSDITKLQPPQSGDAEQAVLGSILKDEDAMNAVIGIIGTPECFYSPRHRMIYQAAMDLYEKNLPVDITTIANQLLEAGKLDKAGGRVYLVEMAESVASTVNVSTYASIVVDKWQKRRLIETCTEIARSAYVHEGSAGELIDAADGNIFRLNDQRHNDQVVPLGSIVFDVADKALKCDPSKRELWVGTRIADLDRMITGLFYGEMTIIGGPPSMGKTSLALDICLWNANFGKRSLIISIDQTKDALAMRLLTARTGLSKSQLLSGKLTQQQQDLVVKEATKLSQIDNILICDMGSYTALDIRSIARREKKRAGLDIVMVDYLQQVHTHRRFDNRNYELESICRILKETAKELWVQMICLSQVSRDKERRKVDPINGNWQFPTMDMLRDSGAIEQEANLVLFPWVPVELLKKQFGDQSKIYSDILREYPLNNNGVRLENLAYICVGKNKDGQTGNVECRRDEVRMRFYSEDRSGRPEPPPVISQYKDDPF